MKKTLVCLLLYATSLVHASNSKVAHAQIKSTDSMQQAQKNRSKRLRRIAKRQGISVEEMKQKAKLSVWAGMIPAQKNATPRRTRIDNAPAAESKKFPPSSKLNTELLIMPCPFPPSRNPKAIFHSSCARDCLVC